MNTLHIRKNDTVIVLSGADKGKKGKVISVDPKNAKVIVEGVNMAHKHQKARRQTDVPGIIQKETPIYACKVMHVCPKCGMPTRPSFAVLDDGSKSRRCKRCKEAI